MKLILSTIAASLLCFLIIQYSLDIETLKNDNKFLKARIMNLESSESLQVIAEKKYFDNQYEIAFVSINALLKADQAYYISRKTLTSLKRLLNILTETLKEELKGE